MPSEVSCGCRHFQAVTESAALAAAQWMGRGDGLAAAAAARSAMAEALADASVKVRIVAAKGSSGPGPLRMGDELGAAEERWDAVVLPLEGMEPLARGVEGALCMLAAGPPGSLLAVPEMYMQKVMVAGPAAGAVDMDAPVARNLKNIAAALGRPLEELVVVVLDRPRHEDLAAQVREAGARLRLIPDGDISAGIAAAVREAGVDVCIGIGGSIEAVLAAAALRCLDGEIQARFWPVSRRQVEQLQSLGIEDVEAKLLTADMAGEGVVFTATAVTGGRFLRGVEARADGQCTETLVLCSRCHVVRTIRTLHRKDGHGRVHLDTR
jgi:fructose-1,6-bisphosphatase II